MKRESGPKDGLSSVTEPWNTLPAVGNVISFRSFPPEQIARRILFYKPLEKLSPQEQELLRRGYENPGSFLRNFIKSGGAILAGSDTAAFVLPGASLHWELELLVDTGLTPTQAIQAATKNNAEFLQKEELGTVEPGKLAHLIIIRKDPLADIKNTNPVDTVIQDGRIMDIRHHAEFVNPIPRTRVVGFPKPKPSIIRVVRDGRGP